MEQEEKEISKYKPPLAFQLNSTQKDLLTYMPGQGLGTCHGPDSTCSGDWSVLV